MKGEYGKTWYPDIWDDKSPVIWDNLFYSYIYDKYDRCSHQNHIACWEIKAFIYPKVNYKIPEFNRGLWFLPCVLLNQDYMTFFIFWKKCRFFWFDSLRPINNLSVI